MVSMPPRRAFCSSSYIMRSVERYRSFPNFDDPKIAMAPPAIFFRMRTGLAISSVPNPAPPMISNSAGCTSTPKCPCSIR